MRRGNAPVVVRGADAVAQQQASLELPRVEHPPKEFSTAETHYRYLLEQPHGGTQNTMATIPVWDGLWTSGNNSMPRAITEPYFRCGELISWQTGVSHARRLEPIGRTRGRPR